MESGEFVTNICQRPPKPGSWVPKGRSQQVDTRASIFLQTRNQLTSPLMANGRPRWNWDQRQALYSLAPTHCIESMGLGVTPHAWVDSGTVVGPGWRCIEPRFTPSFSRRRRKIPVAYDISVITSNFRVSRTRSGDLEKVKRLQSRTSLGTSATLCQMGLFTRGVS